MKNKYYAIFLFLGKGKVVLESIITTSPEKATLTFTELQHKYEVKGDEVEWVEVSENTLRMLLLDIHKKTK